MGKNIVFCADGTWNSPVMDENQDGQNESTNVFKLFLGLDGDFDKNSLLHQREQEKTLLVNNKKIQVAKYIHGVGDSNNILVKVIGGATGAGTITRIIRGYTYISRMYEEGDHIFIIGFSRGAYTARALAGMICAQGLLKYNPAESREVTYKKASKVWYQHQNSRPNTSFLAKLASTISNLPAFISQGNVPAVELIKDVKIKCVAVWDTVGAMGIPDIFGDGEKYDSFRFADTELSDKVEYGFHAVALDEKRNPFIPTLWESRNNVYQRLFIGAHSDVGGGYPQTGLSDISLKWMIEELKKIGLKINSSNNITLKPDPLEVAHEPWAGSWYQGKRSDRVFPNKLLHKDKSITQRIGKQVKSSPSSNLSQYQPKNLPVP